MKSGLEVLRAHRDKPQPAPGIGQLVGMYLDEVEEGRVVFSLVPGPEHYNPIGTVHGGIASTLLDSAMSCAVHTLLLPGTVYTTLELKINFDHAMTHRTGRVRAIGTVIKLGNRIGTAEGRILDENETLIAHATTTCLLHSDRIRHK